jgi:sugar (pentulose or hexulose) kinase
MGIVRRNKAFLITAALILVVGAALFGSVVAVRVFAASGDTSAAALPAPASYNTVSSYGITGYAPLKLTPTAETPSFITSRLEEEQGMVLLVYVDGAADDMEMLSYFQDVKAQYGADSSFMSFEAVEVKDLGDTLDQLRVSNPPILAIIRGNGEVAELYTGWIGLKVMEQVVADAVRGL